VAKKFFIPNKSNMQTLFSASKKQQKVTEYGACGSCIGTQRLHKNI